MTLNNSNERTRVIISWSSGKDSTLTLMRLLDNPDYEVVGLFTTYVKDSIPFQSTPLEIVKAQAKSIGLPLILQELPEVFPSNDVYQSLVINAIKSSALNIQAVAFGDMFCNGIEDYRRSYIEPAGLECVFPLLGENSDKLAEEIIERGIKTFVSTVDTSQLDGTFIGKEYTQEFVDSLPDTVDRCGEDGEFHTLVYDAPCFEKKLDISREEIHAAGRFHSVSCALL